MLSKKLLKEVLGVMDVVDNPKYIKDKQFISFHTQDTKDIGRKVLNRTFSVYVLALKVKEWAWDNGYFLKHVRNENGHNHVIEDRFGIDAAFGNELENVNEKNCCMKNTELESTFKAGECVLKFIKKEKASELLEGEQNES